MKTVEYRMVAYRDLEKYDNHFYHSVWGTLETARMKADVLSKRFDTAIEKRVSTITMVEHRKAASPETYPAPPNLDYEVAPAKVLPIKPGDDRPAVLPPKGILGYDC